MVITKEIKTVDLFEYVMASDITPAETLKRFTEYVEFLDKISESERNGISGWELAKNNFGYYAGYYDEFMRKKVEDLLRAVHPILGRTDIKRTPEEVFQMGQEFAKNGFRKKKTIKLKFPTID